LSCRCLSDMLRPASLHFRPPPIYLVWFQASTLCHPLETLIHQWPGLDTVSLTKDLATGLGGLKLYPRKSDLRGQVQLSNPHTWLARKACAVCEVVHRYGCEMPRNGNRRSYRIPAGQHPSQYTTPQPTCIKHLFHDMDVE
jgi:hypothetical protein